MGEQTFLVEFPMAGGAALHWWLAKDGAIVARGRDADPLAAAERTQTVMSDAEPQESMLQIALMPSTATVVRWHQADGDYTEKQRLAAAIAEVKSLSLGNEVLHISAVSDGQGHAATAAVEQEVLTNGIQYLQQLGLNPDKIIPAGWLIPPVEGAVVQADLGFDQILRVDQMIAPDEPALREHLGGGRTIEPLSRDALDFALAGATQSASLDFRTGGFAKKIDSSLTSAQMKILIWLVAALLLVSIAIPAVQWIKYDSAASKADAAALVMTKSQLGDVESLASAETKLDDLLVSQSRGNRIFSVPASALFSALQPSASVVITRLSYRPEGTLSASLSAVRNEEINPVLTDLQNRGFMVTAIPRTDSTGSAIAEITVSAR